MDELRHRRAQLGRQPLHPLLQIARTALLRPLQIARADSVLVQPGELGLDAVAVRRIVFGHAAPAHGQRAPLRADAKVCSHRLEVCERLAPTRYSPIDYFRFFQGAGPLISDFL